MILIFFHIVSVSKTPSRERKTSVIWKPEDMENKE